MMAECFSAGAKADCHSPAERPLFSGLFLAVIAWKQSQLQWSGAAERILNGLRPAGAPLHP